MRLLVRIFYPFILNAERIENISELPGPQWLPEIRSPNQSAGEDNSGLKNCFFILFSAKSERISLVRKGEIRKTCFRIMRRRNMGRLWEELNTKRVQKEMLKNGKV